MAVVIQDDELKAMGWTEDQFRLEVAVTLFVNQIYTTGQAAKFAGIPRVQFFKELGKRKISIFDEEDIIRELES
ncbi:MAG: UPF0175 family protein [Saprospiraceae bacterium]